MNITIKTSKKQVKIVRSKNRDEFLAEVNRSVKDDWDYEGQPTIAGTSEEFWNLLMYK